LDHQVLFNKCNHKEDDSVDSLKHLKQLLCASLRVSHYSVRPLDPHS